MQSVISNQEVCNIPNIRQHLTNKAPGMQELLFMINAETPQSLVVLPLLRPDGSVFGAVYLLALVSNALVMLQNDAEVLLLVAAEAISQAMLPSRAPCHICCTAFGGLSGMHLLTPHLAAARCPQIHKMTERTHESIGWNYIYDYSTSRVIARGLCVKNRSRFWVCWVCCIGGRLFVGIQPRGAILESPLVVATIPQNQQVSRVDETLLAASFSPWYHEQHEQMLQLDRAEWKHLPSCREDSVHGRGGDASMHASKLCDLL